MWFLFAVGNVEIVVGASTGGGAVGGGELVVGASTGGGAVGEGELDDGEEDWNSFECGCRNNDMLFGFYFWFYPSYRECCVSGLSCLGVNEK